jgi:hypothetical protein
MEEEDYLNLDDVDSEYYDSLEPFDKESWWPESIDPED